MEESKNIDALLEKLSNPKTSEAALTFLDKVTELHESGALDSLFQTVQTVTFLKNSLTDSMVSKNAGMAAEIGEITAEAASPEVLDSIRELKKFYRSGKLRDLFEVTDNISFIMNTISEKMMERNAEMMGELLNIAREAADPSMAEALRELKNLQKSGNLKTLAEASYMITFMANVVSDSMVQRMASFMAAFIEEVSTPQVQDILGGMTKCVSKTVREFAENPPKPGLRNVISLMKDPEVQMGLMFMANIARNMQKCMIEGYSAPR